MQKRKGPLKLGDKVIAICMLLSSGLYSRYFECFIPHHRVS